MKKFLLAIFTFLSSSAFSQLCSPNGITTNPAAPVNTQNPSKLNTFNFTGTQFPLNWIYTFNNVSQINSPFFV